VVLVVVLPLLSLVILSSVVFSLPQLLLELPLAPFPMPLVVSVLVALDS
jgi:hypothetical protein